jgi:hypothetical protein
LRAAASNRPVERVAVLPVGDRRQEHLDDLRVARNAVDLARRDHGIVCDDVDRAAQARLLLEPVLHLPVVVRRRECRSELVPARERGHVEEPVEDRERDPLALEELRAHQVDRRCTHLLSLGPPVEPRVPARRGNAVGRLLRHSRPTVLDDVPPPVLVEVGQQLLDRLELLVHVDVDDRRARVCVTNVERRLLEID